jgi:hypothetical protein
MLPRGRCEGWRMCRTTGSMREDREVLTLIGDPPQPRGLTKVELFFNLLANNLKNRL